MKFVSATYNLSVRAVTKTPEKVIEDIGRFMEECDVLALEETGQAEKVLAIAAKRFGLNIWKGHGLPGQDSTALVTKKKIRDRRTRRLTPATKVGEKGAGPSTLKAKWFHHIKIRAYGYPVWVGVLHTAPSIYIDVRERLALAQTTRTALAAKELSGLVFIPGDYNSSPDHRIRNPLEKVGLASVQRLLRNIDTLRNRDIDDVHYRKHKAVRLVRHWTRKGASDHDAYFAEFDIEPTRFWKLRHPQWVTRWLDKRR